MSTETNADQILNGIITACKDAQKKSRRHPRYPVEVKHKIKELVKEGVSANKISRLTGLSNSYIKKLVAQRAKADPVRILQVTEKPSALVNNPSPILVLKTSEIEISVYSMKETL